MMDIRGMQLGIGTPASYEPFNLGKFKIFNQNQFITKTIVCGKTVKAIKIWNGRKFKLKQEVR